MSLMTRERGSADSAGLEALYPFLYSDTNDLDKVLAHVRQSTVDKAHEILELRRIVRANDGELLVEQLDDGHLDGGVRTGDADPVVTLGGRYSLRVIGAHDDATSGASSPGCSKNT